MTIWPINASVQTCVPAFLLVKLLKKLGATFCLSRLTWHIWRWLFVHSLLLYQDLVPPRPPLHLSLLVFNLTPLVTWRMNARITRSTLNLATCTFTRLHGATQRPGRGAGRCLSTSPLLIWQIFHTLAVFSEDGEDTFDGLSLARRLRRRRRFSGGSCLNNEPHLPQHWRLWPHAVLVSVWWFSTVTTPRICVDPGGSRVAFRFFAGDYSVFPTERGG